MQVLDSTGAVITALTQTLVTDGSGHVFFTPSASLIDGNYTLTTTPTDRAGNVGAVASLPFTIDTHTAVAITAINPDTLGAGTTGTATDFLTKTDETVVTAGVLGVSGTMEAGDQVVVKLLGHDGVTQVGANITVPVVAGATTWTADLSAAKTFNSTTHADDGAYTVSVTATDAAGNTATTTHALNVNTVTTVAYTGLSPDTLGTGTIGTATDNITDNTLPTFTGTPEVGDAVTVTLTDPLAHSFQTTTVVVPASGIWSVPAATALVGGDGVYSVAISAVDKAGNTASTSHNFTLDTTVPVATPVLETASDSAGGGLTSGTWAGPAGVAGTSSDDLTKFTTPTFDITTGTGAAFAHFGASRRGGAGRGL